MIRTYWGDQFNCKSGGDGKVLLFYAIGIIFTFYGLSHSTSCAEDFTITFTI